MEKVKRSKMGVGGECENVAMRGKDGLFICTSNEHNYTFEKGVRIGFLQKRVEITVGSESMAS